MKELIIIGGGPAGLTAAIYAKRAGIDAAVIEQNSMSGGQVLNTYEVDNYPGLPGISGFDLGMKFKEHAENIQCEFIEAQVESVEVPISAKREGELSAAVLNTPEYSFFVVHTNNGDYKSKTIIVATGAAHAKLNVAGEEKLTGMGVSYCATCDGAFFRGKDVAVIGGGDVAVEDAIFLARTCKKVYLIHRRDELRAAMVLQEAVRKLPNVEIVWNTVVEEILGEDMVSGLRVKNVVSGEESSIDLSGVFIAVGMIPNSKPFSHMIPSDDRGYLIAEEDGITGVPGIFAVGDVRTKKLRQVVTAVADGANAVYSIQEYLM